MMAAVTPVAMLFVRCAGGVSHHPDESVRLEDVEVAVDVTTRFVERLASRDTAQNPSRKTSL
jgi:allantoate deiminase